MQNYISSDPLTPAWLTRVLRAAGRLPQGEVAALTTRPSDAFNSRVHFLHVDYAPAQPPDLPLDFVLKQNGDAQWSKEAGAAEVKFYQLAATLPHHPSITVPCYAAAYDEASGDSYLLLQDLSATHAPPVTRSDQIAMVNGVPSKMVIGAVVDTLAQLHAYWWEHPLLAIRYLARRLLDAGW